MRTNGHFGRAVYQVTRREKNDLFAILDRIETGIATATGQLHRVQTIAELQDDPVVSHGNVVSFPARERAGDDLTAVSDNIISIRPDLKLADQAQNYSQPVKGFPPTFYEFFEFIDEQQRSSVAG